MRQESDKNAVGPAVAAQVFAVGGLAMAYVVAQSNPTEWGRSLMSAFWIVVSSAVISAVFAAISLSARMTWYSILLTTLCTLYAGVMVILAVAFSAR